MYMPRVTVLFTIAIPVSAHAWPAVIVKTTMTTVVMVISTISSQGGLAFDGMVGVGTTPLCGPCELRGLYKP